MNWYTTFYLFSIAEKLSLYFGFAGFLCLFGVFLTFVGIETHLPTEQELAHNDRMRTWRPRLLIASVLCLLLATVTPSKKDLLLIIAGGAVGEFVTSDTSAKALPADITKFLHVQIQKATADLADELVSEGERERLQGLSKEQLVDMLTEEKAKKATQP